MDIIEIVERLVEENGIEIASNGELLDVDSISFISTIVSIEQEFCLELPDEYLSVDVLRSIDAIVEMVKVLQDNE